MESSKPRVILIDGLDRTGKSTLIKNIHQLTSFKHILVDRGPISFEAYNEIFDRPSEDYSDLFLTDVLSIALICPVRVLKERFELTNEPPLPKTLEECSSIFSKYIARYTCLGFNIAIVNSDTADPLDLANKIVSEFKL